MSKTVTTSQIQSPPEDSSSSSSSEVPSPFENSKLIGRVSGYPLVHKFFETTQYLYTRAKDSHQIVKTGLQTAEQTLQWANSQPPVVRVERALLNYVDDFGCRQLDHLDHGVVRAHELYNTDYVHAAKTKGSELLHASKDLVDSKVEELRHKSWSELLEPVTSRVAPVASSVGQKTASLVQAGRDSAYSTTLGVVERVLPAADEASSHSDADDELSNHVEQVSDFSSRVRADASVIQQRLQRKLLQQLRTLNIRLNTPERIEQLQRNSVDLIHYASECLHNLQEKASERIAPVRERLPAPPPVVSRVVESSRTRLGALRAVAWQRARALFDASSHAALAYLPPVLLATLKSSKNNLIEFIYDVPEYQARHLHLPSSKSSLLYNHDASQEYEEEEDTLTEQHQQQQQVFQPVPVYTRPQYEVPALVNRLDDQVDEDEEYKSDDNKQDDDVEPDQE